MQAKICLLPAQNMFYFQQKKECHENQDLEPHNVYRKIYGELLSLFGQLLF